MKITTLLSLVSLVSMHGGQKAPSQATESPKYRLLLTADRIFDPTKELLKPVNPVPIDSSEAIADSALRGELVIESKEVIAIYHRSILERFPEYVNLVIAKAFSQSNSRVIGRTDKDEWAKLMAKRMLGLSAGPEVSAALQRLDTNGFAEAPGEVELNPAYKVEVQLGGKTFRVFCQDSVLGSEFQNYLGEKFNMSLAQEVSAREEHLYFTGSMDLAHDRRKLFDQKIKEALNSTALLKECSRRAKERLEVPFRELIDITVLPEGLKQSFFEYLPGRLAVNGLDPKRFTKKDVKKVKITGFGLSLRLSTGFRNQRSYQTLLLNLPDL